MKPIILAGLSVLLISACATSPTGRSQLMLISPEMAISESKEAYVSTVAEITSEHQLMTDNAWVNRISTITGRLVTEAVKKYPESRDWD